VTNEVFFSTSPDFSQSTAVEVSLLPSAGGGALLAGSGFLVLFGVAAGKSRRKWQVLGGGLLVTFLTLLLLACGGGGGGGGVSAVEPTVEQSSLELTDLAPATTYYWKVAAEDEFGGRTESAVHSFTIR
jgi:hypothetical protein